jgi:hypothetical protein
VPYLPTEKLRKVEELLAVEMNLRPGDALLDIPHKPGMFEPDIKILTKKGDVIHRSELTPEDGFVMNDASELLYRAAGAVSVFTAEPRKLSVARLQEIIESAG